MSIPPIKNWHTEFGLDETDTSGFYANEHDVETSTASYAHIVRRAFQLLELDGVWCDQNTPLVYFKLVKQINIGAIASLHRSFWNHGGAAILAIVAPNEVQIYSALARPLIYDSETTEISGFVTSLERASQALSEFLPSVESGEFFHKHAQSFDTQERVDQSLLNNLQATREQLLDITNDQEAQENLDAFLCRLVFTSYLFDRNIIGATYLETIGLPTLSHLRDILAVQPRTTAKNYLYRLFHELAKDFNGDLFSDDLAVEASMLSEEHMKVVEAFFQATDVTTGQQAFWPYDFGVIPIETVSAIYEHFLRPSDKKQGSFYTPRFLAELVLDIGLSDRASLLGVRFLDPSCGSGIFLVGLFNRIAEEWRRKNPKARNDRRARELMKLMQDSIFGIDINPTACRITAFSLYLAYLDQLTQRDIQALQKKGNALPRLVVSLGKEEPEAQGVIWCGDFFQENLSYPKDIDVVIGNPPWGTTAGRKTSAGSWCVQRQLPIPGNQIAVAFMWKALHHTSENARVCLILPHGILFNSTTIAFQQDFLAQHTLERVLNLTDYQRFLFNKAESPALVLSYRREEPSDDHIISYWFPKVDWKIVNAHVMSISEYDRSTLPNQVVLRNLEKDQSVSVWKRVGWVTPRDRRLLDRLADSPHLGNVVRQTKETTSEKPWLIAEGFQPLGKNDPISSRKEVELPTKLFIPARSRDLDLFLLSSDCETLDSNIIIARRNMNSTQIFEAPHVLVNKGFSSIAFADFPVCFRHSLRGISGPASDRNMLIFLTAYLRSPLAKYFLFHTSSNWGVSRSEVHVWELLRLPFPLPSEAIDPERAEQIVAEVALLITNAMDKAGDVWTDREAVISEAQDKINPLVFEYFDILPTERILIEDTINIIIPSFRPSIRSRSIPTIEPSSTEAMDTYTSRVCDTLNSWIRRSSSRVVGASKRSLDMGVGLVVLEKVDHEAQITLDNAQDILAILHQLRETSATKVNTFELMRGIKVFDGNRLYILKPLGQRYWTETAALNDADEIAGSILMQSSREPV
ncbi:MAG: N-6 DNA methylase [Chloroflexota bacterium]